MNNFPSPCACMGPMYGEPLCPCSMKSSGTPRSQAYLDDHTPEAIAAREKNWMPFSRNSMVGK